MYIYACDCVCVCMYMCFRACWWVARTTEKRPRMPRLRRRLLARTRTKIALYSMARGMSTTPTHTHKHTSIQKPGRALRTHLDITHCLKCSENKHKAKAKY